MHGLPFKIRFRVSGLYISVMPPVLVGAAVGMLSAIMGVGGGFIMVPAMIYLLGMPTKVVIGTSLLQIIFVTGFTTMLHATTNQTVDIVLAVLLLVGGVLGAQVGTRIGVQDAGRTAAHPARGAGLGGLRQAGARPVAGTGGALFAQPGGGGLMRALIAFLGLCFTALTATAEEEIVLGLSQAEVSITTNFDGSEILVYGAVKRESTRSPMARRSKSSLPSPGPRPRSWCAPQRAALWHLGEHRRGLRSTAQPSFTPWSPPARWPRC